MAQSIKKLLIEINARPPQVHREVKDNRETGAVWPAHQPDDLPQDYWTDNVLEIVWI